MKLLRIGPQGHEKPAILDERDTLRDLSRHISDISGDALLDGSLDRIRTPDLSHLPAVASDTRVGPCVGRVDEAVCVGLNYSDHAAESGMAIPTEPILFLKASTAICGPYDDVLIPRGSRKTDRDPAGRGAWSPPVYLHNGQVMEPGIEGPGAQRQTVEQA